MPVRPSPRPGVGRRLCACDSCHSNQADSHMTLVVEVLTAEMLRATSRANWRLRQLARGKLPQWKKPIG
jgi:DTW domain-containing protein YfiP